MYTAFTFRKKVFTDTHTHTHTHTCALHFNVDVFSRAKSCCLLINY